MRHTAATRSALSVARTGAANPFYGKTHTADARARISAAATHRNRSRTYEPAPQRITLPDEVTLAYVAGLIDADGSVRFKTDHSTSAKVRRPFVSIYNTSVPLIEWLVATFGHGCVSRGNLGREQVFAWTIQGARDVYALLVAVRPRLVVKGDDADDALEHLRRRYGWD